MSVGMNLAHGAVGGAVTGGLNWLGGKMGLGGSDTYGGAAYGLFSDAAGGAVAGARGGLIGAGIGAVSGMVMGDVARGYSSLRNIYQNTTGAGAMHKQVEAAQEALLLRGHSDSAFEGATVARREAHAREQQRFDARQQAAETRLAAGLKGDQALFAKSDELHRRQLAIFHPQQPQHSATHHPTTVHRVMGHGHAAQQSPVVQTHPAVAAAAAATSTATGGGGGGNDAAVRSAAASLDALAAASGRLQTAFEGLAGRVAVMFKASPSLNLTKDGQQGGWYPGRQGC
jgi:hypothetical protein